MRRASSFVPLLLADTDEVRVECLGGTLRHLSQGFAGPLTKSALARVSFDRALLGAVLADRGICEAELEQTRLTYS
jgi:DeoR/GlpR family transcriptional regulator of sugar metabolism